MIAKNKPAARTPDQDLLELQRQLYRSAAAQQRPVATLLPWLVDRRNLLGAWDRISGNTGARTPGVDGLTCADIERRLNPWLDDLSRKLLDGTYAGAPTRWVDVPKHPGSSATRRLGILTIKDRLVHAAMKQVLEPLLEPRFLPCSFGFRPGRSVPAAVAAATATMSRQPAGCAAFQLGVGLDVASCFDSLPHELVRQSLGKYVQDPKFDRLIEAILAQSGEVRGLFRRRRIGLVQGSPLSPLLCNLVLHPVDEAMTAVAGTGDAASGGGWRYADDLFLAARDAATASRLLAAVDGGVRRLGLRLRQTPRHFVSLDEGVQWLGVRLRRRRCAWDGRFVYGHEVPVAKVAGMLTTLDEMTQLPSDRVGADAFNLARWIVSVNTQLRQWHAVYRFADNARDVFQSLDARARRRIGDLLHQCSGLRGRALWDQYAAHLPRDFWTWEVDGTRLVCLASLAPRAPSRLIRSPEWSRKASRRAAGTAS